MSDRHLYTVFTIQTPLGAGTGTNTATIAGLPEGEDRLNMKEIRALESQFLALCRKDNPQVSKVVLTSWQWLRSDEGMAT